MLGVVPASVSLSAQARQQDGIIGYSRGQITVVGVDRLHAALTSRGPLPPALRRRVRARPAASYQGLLNANSLDLAQCNCAHGSAQQLALVNPERCQPHATAHDAPSSRPLNGRAVHTEGTN